MIEYNPVSDELKVLNNRGQMVKVGPKSKKLIPNLVKYACAEIGLGKSLSNIVPEKSKLFPPMADFIDLLHSDEYKQQYARAENTRSKVLVEKFIGTIQLAGENPEDANKAELVKAMHTAIKLLERSGTARENIQVIFNQNFPEDMWN